MPGAARAPLLYRWTVQLFAVPLVRAGLMFLAAGRVDWLWGWIYAALHLLAAQLAFWGVRDPALIAEREQSAARSVTWDRWLAPLATGLLGPVLAIVAGLDVGRYRFTPALAGGWHLLGGALSVLAVLGLVWAMRVNPFFSGHVRVQSERGHAVIATGPYAWLRHPGYFALLAGTLGSLLLLGSLWACLPALIGALALIARTYYEDRLLRRALPGYAAYAARVRYRLLPGVW